MSAAALATAIYKDSLRLLATAAVLAAITFWAYVTPGGEFVRWLLTLLFGLITLWVLSLPALEARALARDVSRGVATTARVEQLLPAQASRADKPVASGTWIIEPPAGEPFNGRFKLEVSWARDIGEGDRLDVLVDPDEPKVMVVYWMTAARADEVEAAATVAQRSNGA